MRRRSRIAALLGVSAVIALGVCLYARDATSPPPSGPARFHFDHVVVEKAKLRLTLYDGAG